MSRKDNVLKKLEEAVQELGRWSEEVSDESVRRVLIDYVGGLDSLGKEIKQIDEKENSNGSVTEGLI